MKRQLALDDIQSLRDAACRSIKLAFEGYNDRRCRSAISSIDAFVSQSKSDASLCKSRKNLIPIRNLLEGYLDGKEELTASDLKQIRKRASNHYKDFRVSVREVMDAREAKKRTSVSQKTVSFEEFVDDNDIAKMSLDDKKRYFDSIKNKDTTPRALLDNLRKAIEDEEFGEDYKNSFLKNISDVSDVASKLPRRLKTAFALIKAPILPLVKASGPELTRALAKAGIRTQEIDKGYRVFMDQLLLAFGRQAAKPDRLKMETMDDAQKQRYQRRLMDQSLQSNEDYVRECIQVINEHGNIEYTLLSDHFAGHPDNITGINFAWLIPVDVLNKLVSARIVIKDWDFPTPHSWRKIEPPDFKRPPTAEKPVKPRR